MTGKNKSMPSSERTRYCSGAGAHRYPRDRAAAAALVVSGNAEPVEHAARNVWLRADELN